MSRRLAVYLLLATAASTAWVGYRFGGGNQCVQIPILKHYADHSLYAGDLLLTTLRGYTTYFFPVMARLTHVAGEELPYFLTYVAAQAATLAAFYALARLAFGHPPTAWVACALYLLNPLSLAGESSLASRLQHGHVATPLLLWAIVLYLRGRVLPAFGLCGLAFNLHGLYSLHVSAMLATDSALRPRALRPARLLAGIAVFAVLAAPALVWIVRANEPVPSGSLALWLQIMRERSAVHTFPLSQPAALYGGYLLLLCAGALGWASAGADALRRPALHFALAIAALCLIGLVFSEAVPVPVVIKAQLLRSTKWLTYLATLYLARLLTASWSGGLFARAGAVACGLALMLGQPWLLALGITCHLVEPGRFGLPVSAVAASGLVLGASSGAVTVPEDLGLPQLAGRLQDLLGHPLVLACAALALLVRAAAGRRGESPALAAAAAVAGLYVLPASYLASREATRSQAWNEVQLWVRDNTPRGAVILTPPHREGFRQFSERAIVGEWKDGTQQFFGLPFTFEWYRRMQRLGGDPRAFDQLDSATMLALGREFGAQYLVVPGRVSHPFPKLFQNSVAAVYLLTPAEPATESRNGS